MEEEIEDDIAERRWKSGYEEWEMQRVEVIGERVGEDLEMEMRRGDGGEEITKWKMEMRR